VAPVTEYKFEEKQGTSATDTVGTPSTDSGTATGGSTTTLQDTGKSWSTNQWANYTVTVYGGTGAVESKVITSNTSNTLTVPTWTAPDSTSKYIINTPSGILSGSTTPTWTQGKIGSGLSFNGSSAYVTTNNGTPVQVT